MHNRIRRRGCDLNLTLQWIYVPIWTQSNDIIMNYGYEHIIIGSYIIYIYIEKATADLESKYRKVCVVYLHTK